MPLDPPFRNNSGFGVVIVIAICRTMDMSRRSVYIAMTTLMGLLVSGISLKGQAPQETEKRPKNVILMIGDGMGISQLSAAYYFRDKQDAGREPGTVKIWSVFATACDVSEAVYLKYIIARLATYLQIPGYGELLVRVNDWDEEVLKSFRTHKAVTSVGGLIDSVATTAQLAEIEKILPEEWRPAAVGSAKECAEAWVGQFEAGADGLIIHASTPDEFEPVLEEYRKIRPHERFEGRTNRPG